MVAAVELVSATLDLSDADAYMATVMREQAPIGYREAAIKTVDWLLVTGRFAEIAPTLAVSGLMQRARVRMHETHRGLTNWPNKKKRSGEEEPEAERQLVRISPLEMVIAADLSRPMTGRWSDMEFLVSQRRMRLAEMTRFDCLEKATFYGKAAEASGRHQRFLVAIAERLEGTQTVGQVFADGDLSGLWASIERESVKKRL